MYIVSKWLDGRFYKNRIYDERTLAYCLNNGWMVEYVYSISE